MQVAMNQAFKAISDPTRRAILEHLREEDLTAGEIATRFEISWPSISHHLNVLKAAGLVQVEKRGQERLYSLNVTVVQEFLAELLTIFGEVRDEA